MDVENPGIAWTGRNSSTTGIKSIVYPGDVYQCEKAYGFRIRAIG